jgi:hypothetical protein
LLFITLIIIESFDFLLIFLVRFEEIITNHIMSLIKCNDCGLGVSVNAESCPHCGSKDFNLLEKAHRILGSEKTAEIQNRARRGMLTFMIVFFLIIFGGFAYLISKL